MIKTTKNSYEKERLLHTRWIKNLLHQIILESCISDPRRGCHVLYGEDCLDLMYKRWRLQSCGSAACRGGVLFLIERNSLNQQQTEGSELVVWLETGSLWPELNKTFRVIWSVIQVANKHPETQTAKIKYLRENEMSVNVMHSIRELHVPETSTEGQSWTWRQRCKS